MPRVRGIGRRCCLAPFHSGSGRRAPRKALGALHPQSNDVRKAKALPHGHSARAVLSRYPPSSPGIHMVKFIEALFDILAAILSVLDRNGKL